jgi:hypothetical protein
MSRDLKRFWRAQASGAVRGTAEDWRARTGDFREFHGDLLRVSRRPVETVTCRTPCGYGCPRRIQRFDDGTAWAYCPEPEAAEDAYPVSEEALEEYELDPDALAAKVADAVARHDGGERGRAEASGIDNLWQVGWTPAPAWLFLETGHIRWPKALARMLAEIHDPGRLLLPSAEMIGPELKRLFQDKGWAVVLLDQCMEADDAGGWCFVGPLPEVMIASNVGTAETADTGPAYSFTRMGATWEMVFNHERFALRDSRGCLALSYLLENPHQIIPPLQLDALMRGHGTPPACSPGIEAMSREDGLEVERQVSALQARIDGGDPSDAAEAREELSALESLRKKDRGLGGRSRRASDAGDAARKNIGRLLTIVIGAMKDAYTSN